MPGRCENLVVAHIQTSRDATPAPSNDLARTATDVPEGAAPARAVSNRHTTARAKFVGAAITPPTRPTAARSPRRPRGAPTDKMAAPRMTGEIVQEGTKSRWASRPFAKDFTCGDASPELLDSEGLELKF
eukprot:CAMPEP_0115055418 /NCGR_PEP_ID=MMETSP0227-20121206/4639_1 /TAXON_ID=89957 /ORGANISM="Polarella glacialis, Strain CCMP 1383" /LENGTH=129 /DNA_ID=CAMNT_0002440003 /DNA_START=531 /DNA_END=920 /DNA_ORIENTATION=+